MSTEKTNQLKTELPQWILDLYDADKITPHTVVIPDGENKFVLRDVDFHAVNMYKVHRYDELTGPLRPFEGTLKEVLELLKTEGRHPLFTVEADELAHQDYSIPMTAGLSSELTSMQSAGWGYKAFLNAVRKYEKNPADLAAVYRYINLHPMFWTLEKPYKGEHPSVSTEGGWDALWLGVISKTNKKGKLKTTVMLEAGGTSSPGSAMFYHDYNLDVYEKSFDKAYIKLAKLIHRDYDEHGLLRDGRKGPNENFVKKDVSEETAEKTN